MWSCDGMCTRCATPLRFTPMFVILVIMSQFFMLGLISVRIYADNYFDVTRNVTVTNITMNLFRRSDDTRRRNISCERVHVVYNCRWDCSTTPICYYILLHKPVLVVATTPLHWSAYLRICTTAHNDWVND